MSRVTVWQDGLADGTWTKTQLLRDALQLTRELWQWLADNPNYGKPEWAGWRDIGHMSAYCPCCAVVDVLVPEGARHDCSVCPLKGYAWSWMCQEGGSVYSTWWDARINGHLDRAAAAALKMVKACDKALDELK
jgi:hypothetical protein